MLPPVRKLSGKSEILKGQRIFFESGKIDILKKSQGKCKSKINMADFIPLKAGRNNWGHSDLYSIICFVPNLLVSMNKYTVSRRVVS